MQAAGRFFSRFTIPLVLLFGLWMFANVKWGKDFWKSVIVSDGKGYYAYLPATFIYHDLNFGFADSIEQKYYPEKLRYDYRSGATVNGKAINKYFCGVAVLQTPFFLLGHVATKISGGDADGYSKLYVVFFCLGALFYLGTGLFYLKRFLRMHGAGEGQATFLVAVIFFGTNLFYYSLVEPAMSHLYSFACISAFLVYGKRWIDNGDRKSAVLAALLLGIITLLRPVNIFIALWLIVEAKGLLPFIRRRSGLRAPARLLPALVAFCLPVFLQLFIYKIQCGNFFVNSYGTEAFHFSQPHLYDFLFSYRKGLFVYLPLTFVALSGFIPLWKKNRFMAMGSGIFLLLLCYMLSCWWMWYYGGSFGMRVMVEYLPVFAFLLLQPVLVLRNRVAKTAFTVLLLLLVLLCQFQTVQYRYGILHWSEMTEEKYWNVFLKLQK